MTTITLDDLREILVETAGADDSADLTGDILDRDFADLGYDSLALLETAAAIQRRYGIALTDDQVSELRTPREVLESVNGTMAGAE
jgi:minimal PKS acyl carrier protein